MDAADSESASAAFERSGSRRSRLSFLGRIGAQMRFFLYLGHFAFFDGGYRARAHDDEIFAEELDPFVEDSAPPPQFTQQGVGIRSFLPAAIATAEEAWVPSAADRVYAAFDVSQPVGDPQDLRGRDQHIAQLMGGVLFRRTHAVVSGPRGSGKTSLVRVFAQYAEAEGVVVFYAACDRGTVFTEQSRAFH